MKRLVRSPVVVFIVIMALAGGCVRAAADGRQGETHLGLMAPGDCWTRSQRRIATDASVWR
jgi:hypothetical protein